MRQWGDLALVALTAALAASMACGGKELSAPGQDASASDGFASSSSSGSSSGVTSSGSSGSSGGSASSTGSGSSGSSSGSSSGGSSNCGGGQGGGCDMPGPADAVFICPSGDAAVIPPPNTGTCCDQCIEGCCATAWCTCAGDSAGFSDGGEPTGCLGFVACVQTCLYPPAAAGVDGGTVQFCASQCAAAATYTQNQVQEGGNLLSCVAGSCAAATQCGM